MACEGGHAHIVQIMESKADNNSLYFAYEQNLLGVVIHLILGVQDFEDRSEDMQPLRITAENGFVDIVNYLILHGADINITARDFDETALDCVKNN